MQQRLHQLLNFLKRMSGIKQYITKDGRTYHDEANIPYMLPTDSKGKLLLTFIYRVLCV